MTDRTAKGYIEKFLLSRNYDEDAACFDLELILREQSDGTGASIVLRCAQVRSPDYRGLSDFNPGAHLFLAIKDIAHNHWEGPRFEVHDADGSLSFYCRDVVFA